jgi:DNA-binding transcriptional LysR family regulator
MAASMAVELREIETFLVLAEELHFGRTAERLYLSQSRVSQTIRSMEASLGGRLFERTSRRVELTALGERLRDSLQPPYLELQRAVATVREEAAGITGELRISLVTYAAGGPRFDELVRTFQRAHPACQVTTYEAFPGEALNRLRRGQLDLVAHWLPLDQPGLTVGPTLSTEERVLLVRAGHPLAERGWATVEDLADYAIVDADGILPPETVAELYPSRTPSGRAIPRRHREGRTAEVLGLVAQGEVVHPTVTSLTHYYTHPGVAAIPLRGLPAVRTALVRAADRETAAVRAFLELAGDQT